MAKSTKKAPAKKEVNRTEVNGNVIITFDDGSIQIIPAPINLTAEEAEAIFGTSEEEEEEEEEEEGDDEEEEEEEEEEDELTGEDLAEMDFEQMEDLCDDQDLDTDPDDFDSDDAAEVEKLRKAIAKELNLTLPKKSKKGKK